MKNAAVLSNQVIADAYTGCYDLIFRYIYNKIIIEKELKI